jgi:acetylornithine deacetylase/succinyl-diaminopimelate desuccinylase-like protein
MVRIPVFAISYSFGQSLKKDELNLQFSIECSSKVTIENTFNIIGETEFKDSDPSSIVMIGAHLDSVPEGPGINGMLKTH